MDYQISKFKRTRKFICSLLCFTQLMPLLCAESIAWNEELPYYPLLSPLHHVCYTGPDEVRRREFYMKEDGECFFSSIGLTRQDAVQLLLVNQNDLVLQLSYDEIYDELTNNSNIRSVMFSNDAELERLYATHSDENHDFDEYCASSKVFESYVHRIIGQQGKWMSFFREPKKYSVIDALAYILQKDLNVWAGADNNKLSLLHSFRYSDFVDDFSSGTLEVLYQNDNHFNRIVQEEDDEAIGISLDEERQAISVPYITVRKTANQYALDFDTHLLSKAGTLLLVDDELSAIIGQVRVEHGKGLEFKGFGSHHFFIRCIWEQDYREKSVSLFADEGTIVLSDLRNVGSLYVKSPTLRIDGATTSGNQGAFKVLTNNYEQQGRLENFKTTEIVAEEMVLGQNAFIDSNDYIHMLGFKSCTDASFMRTKGHILIQGQRNHAGRFSSTYTQEKNGHSFAGICHQVIVREYVGSGTVVVPQGPSIFDSEISTFMDNFTFRGMSWMGITKDNKVESAVNINASDSIYLYNERGVLRNEGLLNKKQHFHSLYDYYHYRLPETEYIKPSAEGLKREISAFEANYALPETPTIHVEQNTIRNEGKIQSSSRLPIILKANRIDQNGSIKGTLYADSGYFRAQKGSFELTNHSSIISDVIDLSDVILNSKSLLSLHALKSFNVKDSFFQVGDVISLHVSEGSFIANRLAVETKNALIKAVDDINVSNSNLSSENTLISSQTGGIGLQNTTSVARQSTVIDANRDVNVSNSNLSSESTIIRSQTGGVELKSTKLKSQKTAVIDARRNIDVEKSEIDTHHYQASVPQGQINSNNNRIRAHSMFVESRDANVSGDHEIQNAEVYRIANQLNFSATTKNDGVFETTATHTNQNGDIKAKQTNIKTNTITFQTNKISGESLQLQVQEYEGETTSALLKMDQFQNVKAVSLFMPGTFQNDGKIHLKHRNLAGRFTDVKNTGEIVSDGSIGLHATNSLYSSGEITAVYDVFLQGDKGVHLQSSGTVERETIDNRGIFSGVSGYSESVKWMQSVIKGGGQVSIVSNQGSVVMDGASVEGKQGVHVHGQHGIYLNAISKEIEQQTNSYAWFGAVNASERIQQTQNLVTSITGALVDLHSKEGTVEGKGAQLHAIKLNIHGENGIKLNPIEVKYKREVTKSGLTFNLFGIDLINPERLSTYSEQQSGSSPSFIGFTGLSLGAQTGFSSSSAEQSSSSFQHGILKADTVSVSTGKEAGTDLSGNTILARELIADTKEIKMGGSATHHQTNRTTAEYHESIDLIGTVGVGGSYSQQNNTTGTYQPAQVEIGILKNKRDTLDIDVDHGIQGSISQIEGGSTSINVNHVQETQTQDGYSIGGGLSVNLFTGSPGVSIQGGFNTGEKSSAQTIDEKGQKILLTNFSTPEQDNMTRTDVEYEEKDTRFGFNAAFSVSATPKGTSLGSVQLGITKGDSSFGFKYVALQGNQSQSNIGQVLENLNRGAHQIDMLKTNLVDNMVNAAYMSGVMNDRDKKVYDGYSHGINSILHHSICATGTFSSLVRDIAEPRLFEMGEYGRGQWKNKFLNALEHADIRAGRVLAKFSGNDCFEKSLRDLGINPQETFEKFNLVPGSKGVKGEDVQGLFDKKGCHIEHVGKSELDALPVGAKKIFITEDQGQKGHICVGEKMSDGTWRDSKGNPIFSQGNQTHQVVPKDQATKPSSDLSGLNVGAINQKGSDAFSKAEPPKTSGLKDERASYLRETFGKSFNDEFNKTKQELLDSEGPAQNQGGHALERHSRTADLGYLLNRLMPQDYNVGNIPEAVTRFDNDESMILAYMIFKKSPQYNTRRGQGRFVIPQNANIRATRLNNANPATKAAQYSQGRVTEVQFVFRDGKLLTFYPSTIMPVYPGNKKQW